LLLNLLDNAVKYSPAGGKIWLNLSREALSDEALNDDRDAPPPRAYVDIIDQGPGFAPADLPHIFERLYRGDSSRTRETDAMIAGNFPNTGSGLGLAIARQIAIAHGGHITGSNDPLTGGARLRVNLPIRAGTR
jgi:two-component system phosphate regulon sensor histidine kinase PhoR